MQTDADELQVETPPGKSFLDRHGDTLLMVGLVVYVALLLVGTIGNLFDIEAITSFWLYR
ncbi:MAG: hypothetical protein V3V93_02115 [bacterium]